MVALAGLFDHAVEAVGHVQQLRLALRVRAARGLPQALRGVALRVDDEPLNHKLLGAVELEGLALAALQPLFEHGVLLGAHLLQHAAEPLVHDGPEVAAVVADGVLAVVHGQEVQHAVAHDVLPVFVGIDLVNGGAGAVLVPEVPGLLDVFPVLGVEVVGVGAAGGEGVDLVKEPVEGVLGVQRAGAELHARMADDQLVVAHGRRHLFKQLAHHAPALEDADELRVGHVELRHDPVTVDVDFGLLAAVHRADLLDPLGNGCVLIHPYASLQFYTVPAAPAYDCDSLSYDSMNVLKAQYIFLRRPDRARRRNRRVRRREAAHGRSRPRAVFAAEKMPAGGNFFVRALARCIYFNSIV